MIKKKNRPQRIYFAILILIFIFTIFIPLTAHAATLLEAAGDGDIKTVTGLLDKGTDVDEQNAHGMTALTAAALKDSLEMTRLLLDKGADIGRENDSGETVLMCAVLNDNPKLIGLLLDRGAQINEEANNGMTALGWAAFWGSSEVVRLLIDKGADIDTAMVGLEKYSSGDNNFAAPKATEGVKMLKRMKR